MSLYFFHLRDGEDILLDPDGRDLPDLEAVAGQALKEARSILSHEVLSGTVHLDQRIDVEDGKGRLVHALEFSQAVQIVHPHR